MGPERRTRLPSPTTRDVFPKRRLREWFKRQRSTRQRMMQTRTVSRRRTDLRTTATVSRVPLAPQKLKERSQLMTRRSLRMQLKSLSNGLTPTSVQRRKSLKRSKRLLRVLQCQFSKQWVELQEEQPEEHHQQMIQQAVQLLKRLIKRFEIVSYNIFLEHKIIVTLL